MLWPIAGQIPPVRTTVADVGIDGARRSLLGDVEVVAEPIARLVSRRG